MAINNNTLAIQVSPYAAFRRNKGQPRSCGVKCPETTHSEALALPVECRVVRATSDSLTACFGGAVKLFSRQARSSGLGMGQWYS